MIKRKARVVSSEGIYEGKWLSVRKDNIVKPDGSGATYEIVERRDVVIIIPFSEEQFTLVRQYRYAMDEDSIEFPQGFVEDGESPEDAAKRELMEEVGMVGEIKKLGELNTSSGFMEQTLHIYQALFKERTHQKLDDTEGDLRVLQLSSEELKDLIRSGKIKNSPTLAAFSLFLIR